ncbi:hypothetical protein niasHT_027354 [Heterodera trifolii]|uniref:Uncharacterized protein n=1 Tax=Heterodera trifolii TaxID=157864 RepID=A0ABD2JTQ9_9BILA
MIANLSEQTMDWALAKACEMAEKLWEKAKLGTKTANECVGEEMGQNLMEMCAGGTSKAKEIAQNWGKSALIATGQCVLAQMQTEEEQIQEEQNAEGMAKLAEFDASFKECAKALAPEQKAKSGIDKLLKAKANQQLRPSDLVQVLLDEAIFEQEIVQKFPESFNVGKQKNFVHRRRKRKNGGKGKKQFGYDTYIKMIFFLFITGQISTIAFLLLLFLLPDPVVVPTKAKEN